MDQTQLEQPEFLKFQYTRKDQQPYSIDVDFIQPNKYLQFVNSNQKLLKSVQTDLPVVLDQRYSLVLQDVSLTQKGPNEDKTFAQKKDIHFNLRRGQSILQYIDKESKNTVKTIVARKGLHKFFDIHFQFLDLSESKDVPKKYKTSKVTDRTHGELNSIILDPVRVALLKETSEQNQILIYKSEKANGENAQISYVADIDAWVICSKNVSLIARTRDHIKRYEKDRFQFGKLIGDTWFDILDKIPQEKIQELKQYMDGKTFVAEYCGNQEYQHLVKYTKIDLLFYAIVQNDLEMTCLPLELSTKVFEHFGLTACSFEKQVASNWDEFNYLTFKLFEQVSKSSIEEEGEGGVLYFFKQNKHGQVTPLSLCKLKTIEYRIFRKLREKLKTYAANRQKSGAKIYSKFQSETQELVQFFDSNKPLEYYFQIAKTAFEYVQNTNSVKELNIISAKYISFLDMIIKMTEEKATVNRKVISKYLESVPLLKEELETGDIEIKKTRVVIVSPAFYVQNKIYQDTLKNYNCKELKTNWKTNQVQTQLDQIEIYADHFPRDLRENDAEKIKKSTFFIITGFSEKTLDYCIQQIESQEINYEDQLSKPKKGGGKKSKKNKDTGIPPDFEPYLRAKNRQQFLESQIDYKNAFVDSLKQFLPKNYVEIEDLYQEGGEKPEELIKEHIEQGINYLINENFDEIILKKQSSSQVQNQFEEKQQEVKEKNNVKENDQGESQEEEEKKQGEDQPTGNKQKLIVFIPMTIPATGKTTFVRAIEKQITEDYNLRILSSDQLRASMMDELLKKNKNKISKEEAFSKTGKQAGANWKKELGKIVKDTSKTGKDKNIIFLDKNHPPNSIQDTISLIENNAAHFDLKVITVVPKCFTKLDVKSKANYPFSAHYYLTCINRAMNRESHETLEGDTIKVISIVVMFMTFFKNHKNLTGKGHCEKYGIDNSIELPFHKEDEASDSKIPQNLRIILEEAIYDSNPRCPEKNTNIPHLIQAIYESQIEFPEYDINEQTQKFQEIINALFKQYWE